MPANKVTFSHGLSDQYDGIIVVYDTGTDAVD